jgi:hypothetical protein
MTKLKDSTTINSIILELAKADSWMSRDDLKQKTGKQIQTIKNYLKNDISNLIDTEDFKEYVNRNKGKGKTAIEKYKLKSGLDNLSAVFNYIHDEKAIKLLMQTDYYKNFIPEIESKISNYIKYVPENKDVDEPITLSFMLLSYATTKELFLKKILNMSPSATSYILNYIKQSEDVIFKAHFSNIRINSNFLITYVVFDFTAGIIKGTEWID